MISQNVVELLKRSAIIHLNYVKHCDLSIKEDCANITRLKVVKAALVAHCKMLKSHLRTLATTGGSRYGTVHKKLNELRKELHECENSARYTRDSIKGCKISRNKKLAEYLEISKAVEKLEQDSVI